MKQEAKINTLSFSSENRKFPRNTTACQTISNNSELLRDFSNWETREEASSPKDLTDEEIRLLEAYHQIEDKVQRRNILDLIERMVR